MSEQTATNPQTGERIVLRNGQWVPLGQPAAPAQPAQPTMARGQDPIVRPADPYRQTAEQRAQSAEQRAQQDQNIQATTAGLQNQLAELTIAERQREADRLAEVEAAQETGIADSIYQIRNVIDSARRAKELSRDGWFATGFGADATRGLGGTPSNDVAGLLNTIGGNTAFDRLQRMRNESPTGGALGAVTQPELEMLRDSIASLNQSQSDAQFQANMDRVAASYQRVLDRLEGRDPDAPAGQQSGDGLAAGMGGSASGGTPPPSTPPESRPPVPDMTLQDMYPQGAELGMDTIGRDDPFNEMEYLRREYGIEPEDERRLVGALNARTGDAQFGERDVLTIYESLGMTPPDEAGIAQIVGDVRQGAIFGGIDTSAARAEYEGMLDTAIESRGGNPETMSASIGGGAVQGITVGLADEISGLGGALNSLMEFENPATGYRAERDVARREFSRAEQANPTAFAVSNIGGSLATGGARVVPAAMRSARPIAAAAREGAIFGGAFGFGQGEGAADSVTGAGVGALTGAAGGAVIQRGAQALAPVGRRITNAVRGSRANRPDPAAVRGVVDAGERMGVTVRRADVDPGVRDSRAQILQSPAGQAVRAVETDDLAEMEQALARRTGSEGVAPDKLALGESVQSGTRRVIDRARARASTLYKRAYRASEGVEVAPSNMIAAIDENIAELTRNGATQNAAAINYLRGVRNDAMNGGPQATGILDASGKPIMRGPKGLSVEVLRSQRTNLRGNINQAGLSMTDMERRMTGILQAASSDIEAGLANNAAALAMFREADGLWREQAEFANSIGRRILGTPNQPVTPETAAQRIAAFVRGDFNRARTLYAELPEATRAEISAQVAANLGRKANGDFSLATFLTHTGPGRGRLLDERTTRLIFGERGVEAIRDLRTLAGAKVSAAERSNYSNTGGIVQQAGRGLRSMILGAVGVTEGGLAGGAVTIAAGKIFERLGENRAVRLLTNPDFTRWLRSLPEATNPKAIDNQFDRLRRISAGNAQFNNDVQEFQRALIGAANDNAGVAGNIAASEQEQQKP